MAPTATSPFNLIGVSLWQDALGSLDENLKARFGATKTTYISDISGAVLKAAREKRGVCLQKRGNFKRASGDVVIVRDVAE